MTYDLSAEFARATTFLAGQLEEFAHIDPKRILYCVAKTRAAGSHGMFASCQPLRFEAGEFSMMHEGEEWRWPPIVVKGSEMLYAITAYVPRFLDLPRDQKIETLVHELYHISPYFNGDIRRLGRGRNAHHGPSRAFYDKLISPFVREAQTLLESEDFPFLSMDYNSLVERYGAIFGQRFKGLRPRRASAP